MKTNSVTLQTIDPEICSNLIFQKSFLTFKGLSGAKISLRPESVPFKSVGIQRLF